MLQETLIRKTRLLRKIGPMAMRSSVTSKIVLSRAILRWPATNDLEIAFPKREQHLIDALAIQNSDRSPLHDVRNHACDFIEKSCMQNCVCFADGFVALACPASLFELRRGSLRSRPACRAEAPKERRLVEPDGIEPTTSCLQSRRSPS